MYNIPIEWEMSTEFLKTWSKSKKEEHRTGGQIKKKCMMAHLNESLL